ncbi:MAG: leucine-rich repeat protein, partial [Tannerellaceae bacterium]|nr:leucine-rich repeat protein [Tannerellaceae bacterium]
VGETAGYSVTFTPTNPTNKNVTWSSSNPDVADVSDRNAQTTTVTAKKAGTATIQVVSQDGNKSASVNITVTASTPTFTENDIIMAGPLFSSNTLTEKQKYTIAPRVGNATDHEWTGNFYLRENGTTIKTWSSTTVESHNVSHSTSLPAFEYTPTAGKKTIAFYFRTSGTSNDILVGSKTVENPIQITVNPAAVTPTLTFEDGTNYKSLTIDPERYIENIPVKSNIAWEVSMPAEATWLKVQKSGNNVYVDVASNEGNKNNGVVVTIKGTGTNANVTATLRIYQTAPYITNLPSFIPAKAAKTTETYSVESNVSWIVYWGDEGKVDWLSASPTSLTKGKKNVSFIIEENQSPEPRRKAFYIRGAGINKEILIVQGGKVETPKASITIKPKTVEFNYKGEKTTSGNVQIGFENASDVSWEATSSATWFSFPSKGTGAINNFAVTNLSENKSTTIDRTGTITINGTGQYATLEPQTLTVRQTKAPPPFIKLAQSLPNGQLNFDYTGNPHSQTFRIESNIDWTITKPDWLIVEPFNSNGQTIRDIVVNAKRNDGNKNRSGKITVKGIDRYSNYSVEVDVIQGEKIVQSKPELRVLMNGIEVQDGTEVEFNASECGENISVPLQILSNDKWEIETQYEKPDRTIQSSREFGGDGSGTYQKFDSKIFKNVSGERRGSITIRHSHSTGSESIKSISIRFTQRAEEFVYDNDTHVISRYNGTNSNVIIPYCVKIIAANAFNSAQIESINLSNVAEIGDDAFRFCDKIKTIRIPSTLTSIGDEVFKDCKSLEKFEGKSERYDADEYGVLYDIKSFPAKLLVFPPKLVRDSYTIGASDKTQNRMVIGDNAFDNNIYLAEVVINRQVYNDHTSPIAPIGKEAFKTCTNLRTVIAYWEIGEVDFIPDINGKNVFSDKTLSEGKLMIPPGTPGRKEDIKAIYKAKGWNFKNIEFLDNSNSVQVNSESSSNNSGILSFAMNIPTSETYTGSFVIYTPTGVDLSMNVSTRSSSFQNAHTYEIQQISENGYIVDIKPSSDVNIRSDTQNTYQNILSIPYNLHMPVLEYDNFVTINGLHLIGNTSVIYQDEIQVPLAYTVDNEVLPDRDELLYYPNPVDNTLTVQIPNPDGEMAAVALINLSGQIVYRTETSEAVYHVDVQS